MGLPGRTPADAADARTFEPRPESERALNALDLWLAGPLDTAVIAGAPGAGTTFVLRHLEAQERERRAVLFSPFLHIGEAELEGWLDGLARAAGFASLAAWLAPAAHPPLLLVDEAHAAAPAVLEELARLRARVGRGAPLRVCLGGCDGPALERASECVGGRTAPLLIELPPWSDDELRTLARALCEVAAVDAEALVAAADGSPGLLRLIWEDLRERGPAALPPLPAATPAEAEPPPAPPPLSLEREPELAAAAPSPEAHSLASAAEPLPSVAGTAAEPLPWLALEPEPEPPPLLAERPAEPALPPALAAEPAQAPVPELTAPAEEPELEVPASLTTAAPEPLLALEPEPERPAPALAAPCAAVHGLVPAPEAEPVPSLAGAAAELPPPLEPEPPPPVAAEPAPVPPLPELEPELARAFVAPPEPPPPLAFAPRSEPEMQMRPAPRGPLQRRDDAAAAAPQRPRSRLARLPWFHAAALVLGFLLGLVGGWEGWGDGERLREPAVEASGVPALGAVSAPPPEAAAPAPVRHDVQVNAHPWAWIRIDGETVGVTPLVKRDLLAGPHEFEATFPDGRQQRRTVEIGPDSRFVSFAD